MSDWPNHFTVSFAVHASAPPVFPVSRAKLPHGVSCIFPHTSPSFFSRVLPASRLRLHARLRTCRRASAVARWAHTFGRWCAASPTSAATANTAATTTQNSTASKFFTTRSQAASALPARCQPGVISAVRASPLGELFRPGKLVKQKAGAGIN
jgi:hypothetical protein